jgi:cysteine desulfurase / selenocysteine lyase
MLLCAVPFWLRQDIARRSSSGCRSISPRVTAIAGTGPATPERRLPVFSFTIPGIEPLELLQRLDALGIAVRAGDLAALPLLKRFSVTAATRASCYLYTSRPDLDRLADGLLQITASSKR